MAELPVVRRYVRALFEVALRQQAVEQIEADLNAIDAVLRQTPRLMRVLKAPTIARPRKQQLVQEVFGSRVSPLTLRFLLLLLDKRREAVLEHARAEYQRLLLAHRNLLPAEVVTALPLQDPQREALRQALARRTGKQIQLRERVDESIMGGVIVRLGDTVLDGSVRAQLGRLRDAFLSGSLSRNGQS